MVLTRDDIEDRLKESRPLLADLEDIKTQLQPNGVDFSISALYDLLTPGRLAFSNDQRKLPEISSNKLSDQTFVHLKKGCYLVEFREYMRLPNDIMAIGRPRSSLLRMGATVDTAVWDAGFEGVSQSLLIVESIHGVELSLGARIMQVVFIRTDRETGAYTGVYKQNR